ncbi:hypothetical protein JJE00_05700 [Candidatus Bathyarchaeota archaeon]|nr:hypothetical protein [Candidatus Bathyarchaeota archaeon]
MISPLWLGFKSVLGYFWTGGRIQIGHVATVSEKRYFIFIKLLEKDW